MNVRCAALIFATTLLISCSRKTEPAKAERAAGESENEQQPPEDKIAEDCLSFLRATKVVPQTAGDCPGCSAGRSEVFAFREMRIERTAFSANGCEVTVRLRAVFNPGPAGTISGGLTGWIPQEQRLQYLNGHPPEGDQHYRVKIIYKRTGEAWRAIEFDRADP
jgi:hypothetical protein